MRQIASAAFILVLGLSVTAVGLYDQSSAGGVAKGVSCYSDGAVPRCLQPVPLIPPAFSPNGRAPHADTLSGTAAREQAAAAST
jgi:hypothetical protein